MFNVNNGIIDFQTGLWPDWVTEELRNIHIHWTNGREVLHREEIGWDDLVLILDCLVNDKAKELFLNLDFKDSEKVNRVLVFTQIKGRMCLTIEVNRKTRLFGKKRYYHDRVYQDHKSVAWITQGVKDAFNSHSKGNNVSDKSIFLRAVEAVKRGASKFWGWFKDWLKFCWDHMRESPASIAICGLVTWLGYWYTIVALVIMDMGYGFFMSLLYTMYILVMDGLIIFGLFLSFVVFFLSIAWLLGKLSDAMFNYELEPGLSLV